MFKAANPTEELIIHLLNNREVYKKEIEQFKQMCILDMDKLIDFDKCTDLDDWYTLINSVSKYEGYTISNIYLSGNKELLIKCWEISLSRIYEGMIRSKHISEFYLWYMAGNRAYVTITTLKKIYNLDTIIDFIKTLNIYHEECNIKTLKVLLSRLETLIQK